jgi:hypothetical protein
VSRVAHPITADGSFLHDGTGDVPSIQYPSGGWDFRPHRDRVISVDELTLKSWASLADAPGTPACEARMLRPITVADNEALKTISEFSERLESHKYMWARGVEENSGDNDALVEWDTKVASSWSEVILQGPMLGVATPFAKEPNPGCKSNKDYATWDLLGLQELVIPRTNYHRVADLNTFRESQIKREDGVYLPSRWRAAWRRMTVTNTERSFFCSLLFPGPTHVHAVHTLAMANNRKTATIAGLWASLPMDNLVKVSGKADVQVDLVRQFPAPLSHPLTLPLLLRTLRLNCLTRDYAPIWEELFDETWLADRWTAETSKATVALEVIAPEWDMKTPLRTDYDRRMALVEIDALVALMLGLTAEQLCAMYRSQFAVLRKYEWEMFFHPDGHKIGASTHNVGVRQTDDEGAAVKAWKKAKLNPEAEDIEPPADWIKPDREAEMTRAYQEFARRLAAGEYPEIPADEDDEDQVQPEGTK